MKELQIGTQQKIGDAVGLSRKSVNRIKLKTASPEVLALVPFEEKKLLDQINETRDKALRKLNLKLDTDDIPGEKLSTIFGTLYDKSRLESSLPTQITQTFLSDTDLAKELFRRMIENHKWSADDALEGVKQRFPNVPTADIKLLGDGGGSNAS